MAILATKIDFFDVTLAKIKDFDKCSKFCMSKTSFKLLLLCTMAFQQYVYNFSFFLRFSFSNKNVLKKNVIFRRKKCQF